MMESSFFKHTMIIFWTFLLFVISSDALSQKDTLIWRVDYKLSWTDFEGRPQRNKSHGAIASTGIKAPCYISKENVMQIEVYSIFYKSTSWVKPNEKTDEALSHEQGHFDIAEIAARRIRQQLVNQKFKKKTAMKKYKKIIYSVSSEMTKMQELYDRETDFHRNKEQQKNWDEKIKNELKELEDYQQRDFRIEL
jgi:hypothetical protein